MIGNIGPPGPASLHGNNSAAGENGLLLYTAGNLQLTTVPANQLPNPTVSLTPRSL